jgi:hypothetical protein
LLEWLTSEFVDSGWRLKRLHRLIMTSTAYRQSSTITAPQSGATPRLLDRFPVRRIDAESIRDGMLFVSGELDLTLGGPYVPTVRNGAGEVLVGESSPGATRRSIYLQQKRTQVVSQLALFDGPSLVFNCPQRMTSTMPLQSLTLLNSEFAVNRARQFAARLDREAGADIDRRIAHAFQLAICRDPSSDELAAARRFIDDQSAEFAGTDDARGRAWSDLCQMLLASNLFLYVE